MSELNYAYAVARIRVLEKSLLSDSDIEQMTTLPDEAAVIAYLKEKGWGEDGKNESAEELLLAENAKVRQILQELKLDPEVMEVFTYQDIYHNLKAAVKEVCTQDTHPGVFVDSPDFGGERMVQIVRDKEWNALPEHMREAAAEAYETLLHTRDGQLCDIIIDKAALNAIAEAGKDAKEEVIRDYASRFVAVADIRIAARASAVGKTRDFLNRALAPSGEVGAEQLAQAASAGREAVIEYLRTTKFAEAADALDESPSSFERWCDNAIIESLMPQKYNPFSGGPVIAYYLARENEIRMARILLTAKANELPEDAIRMRARKMYV